MSLKLRRVKETQQTPIKVNVNKFNEQEKKQKAQSNSEDIYQKAREQLYNEFIQDMKSTATEISLNKEQIERANQRHKQIKLKRNIAYVTLISFIVLVMFLGVYNVFFKKELTYEEIALIANVYNRKTNFPEDGVEGFLNTNVSSLIMPKLILPSDITEIDIKDPVVTKIAARSDEFANIYFYVIFSTDKGEERVNCILPLHWDEEEWQYNVAGEVMITPAKMADLKLETVDNPFLEWEDGIAKASEEDTNKSRAFVDNFFTFLYEGKDITPYYDGEELSPMNVEYYGMVDYVLYQEKNNNGFNAKATINIKINGEISYQTEKYLLIEKSGNSWIIKRVL